ncbi:holin [Lysobacter koreensis]|uniref:Holin n=1 Tax=Lysobacter koreensis TaxID=266122 RepID=A0ABW2YJH3_9GAMM
MNETSDALGLLAAKTATYGGGASAFVFGLSANEVAAIVGALVAVVGLCVQVFYNRRKDRREAEYHAERMTFRAKYMEPEQSE